MAFRDPIIGGESVLIRNAIKSPDYSAGVSGWSINRDGTAEFNDVVVRGEVYVIDPDGSYVRIYDQDPGDGAVIEFGLPTAAGTVLTPGSISSTTNVPGTGIPGEPGTMITSPTVDGTSESHIYLISDTVSAGSEIDIGATNITLDAAIFLTLGGKFNVEIVMDPGGTFTVQGSSCQTNIDGTLAVDGLMTGHVPYCRVNKTAVQSLANNTIVPITFTAETEDDRGWHSNVTNPSRIIPDLPGRYLVIGNLTFAANATGDRRGYILKNGATSGRWSRDFPSGAVQVQTTVVGIVDITSPGTDYIEIGGLQTSGGALDALGAGDTTFSCTFEVIYQGKAP